MKLNIPFLLIKWSDVYEHIYTFASHSETSCTPCSEGGTSHTCWCQSEISRTPSSCSEISHTTLSQQNFMYPFLRVKLHVLLVSERNFTYPWLWSENIRNLSFSVKIHVPLVSETNFTHLKSQGEISCTIGLWVKLDVPLGLGVKLNNRHLLFTTNDSSWFISST